jgi:hypothetical protein
MKATMIQGGILAALGLISIIGYFLGAEGELTLWRAMILLPSSIICGYGVGTIFSKII